MLVVEAARLDEVRSLVDLAFRHLDKTLDDRWLAEQVATGACMVARDVKHDRIIGFVVARREDGCLSQLLALAVHSDYRGQGIGTALLRAAREQMTRAGAMQMRLHVRSDNERAQAFYGRHGFAPAGYRDAAYSDGAAALEFTRPL